MTRVRAGPWRISYAERGPAGGAPVVTVHG